MPSESVDVEASNDAASRLADDVNAAVGSTFGSGAPCPLKDQWVLTFCGDIGAP